jgi:uracil phosphoribosyltransferase
MPRSHEIYHRYGPNVHILDSVWATSLLTHMCNQNTPQHEVRQLTKRLYRDALLHEVIDSGIFPTTPTGVLTPMSEFVGNRAMLTADTFNPATQVAIANLLRAGDIPSAACMDELGPMLLPGKIELHYHGAGRTTDENHQVTGTAINYKKDGHLHDRVLLIPDPMGATGGTIVQTLTEYGDNELKLVRAIVTMHLIITPEYIRRVTAAYPQVQIYALRLDRGMSDQEVIDSVPGTFPDREFGLNEFQYVVPGFGDGGKRVTGIS